MRRIGIFSSFAEPVALQLTDAVLDFVRDNYSDEACISFIFSNRGFDENLTTDALLQNLKERGVNLVIFSAAKFKPELRKEAKRKEKEGNDGLMRDWRNEYGEQVLNRLPPTDFDLLLGDWLIWGENMCKMRNGLNLHPALPDGPKGEWYNVVWELVEKRATESGVMMHAVTPELDRGPVVTYCRYSLQGPGFDELWQRLPGDNEELRKLIAQEAVFKEKTIFPLHQKIREVGLKREFPLILQTTAACLEGRVRLEGGNVKDAQGTNLEGGYDLTSEVEKFISYNKEGTRKRDIERS